MSNIEVNYFKLLEVLSSLNIEAESRPKVGRLKKMSDLEVISLNLTAEYMSIDSENNLFENIDSSDIENLLERS